MPAPGLAVFQGGLANLTPHATTTYDFSNDDRAPLLFISGGSDHILPPAIQRESYEKNAQGYPSEPTSLRQGVSRQGRLARGRSKLGGWPQLA